MGYYYIQWSIYYLENGFYETINKMRLVACLIWLSREKEMNILVPKILYNAYYEIRNICKK